MLEGFDFGAIFTAAGLAKLGQIIIGDLTMAGDNVVIMGSLASGLPPRERKKVLMFGVAMALVCLIFFAVIATQLLRVTGLVFAGGLLLLWVAYNMWREVHPRRSADVDDPDTEAIEGPPASKTFLQAAIAITVADLSMDRYRLRGWSARNRGCLLSRRTGHASGTTASSCGFSPQTRRIALPEGERHLRKGRTRRGKVRRDHGPRSRLAHSIAEDIRASVHRKYRLGASKGSEREAGTGGSAKVVARYVPCGAERHRRG